MHGMAAAEKFQLALLVSGLYMQAYADVTKPHRHRLRQSITIISLLALAIIIAFTGDSLAAQLKLTWSDNSDIEEGFEIQREDPDAGFSVIALVGANVNHFSDLRLAPGKTYCYRVRAFNAEDLSDFSNLGCATTPTTVSVSRLGSGIGTVLSSPSGIDCGHDCVEPYAPGTVVSLIPNPAEGSVFDGWNGAGCAGTGICIFNVETDLSITAVFASINPEATPQPSDPPPPPINPSPPLLILTSLSADLVSPQFTAASVTFTAAATGGTAPLLFKWWVFDGTDWRVKQEWTTSNTFVFAPTAPGEYIIGLWVRSSGNNDDSPENDAVLTQAFTITPLSCPTGQYLGEFYNNMNLSDSPSFAACNSVINFNWADGGGPGPGVSRDNFSARWTGRFPFSAGVYDFVATADDGIRVRIDGNLIIDGWVDQAATTYQAALDISEGEHEVKIEYYQNGGEALTQFDWQRVVSGAGDNYVMFEGGSLTVEAPGVLGNDNELNGNPLTALLVSTTTNGSLALNPDGSFSYTPNPHFNGTDSFTYRADNGSATSNSATVNITVIAVNDIPVASNDAYVVMEDNSLVVAAPGVLANDNDDDASTTLTAMLVTTTSNGTLTFNPDGSFEYTPNTNFDGNDSFTYKALDAANAESNVAMVTIAVNALNDAPVANNDNYSTNEDNQIVMPAPGVLSNDTDIDSPTLTASLVDNPLYGAVTLNTDGSFTYTPNPDFNGNDSFTYRANDGTYDSNVAMVTIAVNALNDAPAASVQFVTTNEDTPVIITLEGSDTDSGNLTLSIVTAPANGTLGPVSASTCVANGSGSTCSAMVSYTPAGNFNGSDSFTFRVSDGTLNSAGAMVSIIVNAVNDKPTASASPSSLNLSEDAAPANVTLSGSDLETLPANLTLTITQAPVNGVLMQGATILGNGSTLTGSPKTVTYQAGGNFSGLDSFKFRVTDTGEGSSPALDSDEVTVNITTDAANDAPVAANDSYSTNEDTTLNISAPGVLGNDSDIYTPLAGLSAILVSGPSNGRLSLNANGSFSYAPNLNFNGTDNFAYKVNDGAKDSNVATVTISVNAVNDAPAANDQTVSTDEDTALPITLTASDVEGNPMTYVIVSGPTNGALTGAAPNVTYTPAANYNGPDSFTFKANDGSLDSNIATVTIAVNAVNDAPVAADDSYSTNEDTVLVVTTPGVLANDSDVDTPLAGLSAVLISTTSNGMLTFSPDGSFSYTPNPHFNGTDSFTYRADNGSATSNLATVTILVNPATAP